MQDAFIDLDIKSAARPERIRATQARSELKFLFWAVFNIFDIDGKVRWNIEFVYSFAVLEVGPFADRLNLATVAWGSVKAQVCLLPPKRFPQENGLHDAACWQRTLKAANFVFSPVITSSNNADANDATLSTA